MSLKIPKKRVFVIVNFVGDKKVRGNIFINPQSSLHYGEEQIIDLLNNKEPFLPFEIKETSSIRIINKKSIISISTSEELKSEGELGKRETITVALTSGRNLNGELIISGPEDKLRVLDFFNDKEKQFFRLFTEAETHYINISHVRQVIPS